MTCFVCAGGKTPPQLKSHTVIRERAEEGRTESSNGVKEKLDTGNGCPSDKAEPEEDKCHPRTSVSQHPALEKASSGREGSY